MKTVDHSRLRNHLSALQSSCLIWFTPFSFVDGEMEAWSITKQVKKTIIFTLQAIG